MAEEHIKSAGLEGCCAGNRISWSAVIAGVVMTLVIKMALAVLGAGLGLMSEVPINPWALRNLAVGGAIWWTISAAIAFFIGGMISSRYSSADTKTAGGMQGLLVWGLTTILIAGIVGVIGGGLALVGASVGTTVIGKAVPAFNMQDLQQLQAKINERLGFSPDQVRRVGPRMPEIAQASRDLVQDPQNSAKRERLIVLLQDSLQITREDAQSRVDSFTQGWNRAQEGMRQFGEKAQGAARLAGGVTGKAALGLFVIMALEALAAYAGGRAGVPFI